MCSLALAFSCLPAYGIENAADSLGRDPGEPAASGLQGDSENLFDEDSCEFGGFEYRDSDELVPDGSMSLMVTNDEPNENDGRLINIKSDSDWVQWYDRIDIPEDFQDDCKSFYNRLVEACDNDGDRDFLIEDKYINGTANSVPYEYQNFSSWGYSGIRVGVFKYKYTTDDDLYLSLNTLYECAFAVRAAFDRDHPEVFWLTGGAYVFYTTSTIADVNGLYTASVYLAISGIQTLKESADQDDVRISSFTSEDVIKYAIGLREARVRELLAYVGVDYEPIGEIPGGIILRDVVDVQYDNAQKVRFFNRWLTYNNGYNTQSLYGLTLSCPLAFECLSALSGKCGSTGPVCEGYSRAFKTLCDACGISCVISDGLGDGEPHMWNYVLIDDKWYGVDVTWNDPGKKTVARSGDENEVYLLVGADTKASSSSKTFIDSHIVENRHFDGGLSFTNGPQLVSGRYDLNLIPETFSDIDNDVFASIDISNLDNDLALCNCSSVGPYEYTGKAITPVPLVVLCRGKYLHEGEDFRITYDNNVNAGTASMKLIGIGSYLGSKTISFAINPQPIKVGTVEVADAVYTGKARIPKPKVTVKNSGCRLGSEYTVGVSYSNNVNAGMGKATVTIKGLGNFGGSVSVVKNFLIYPKKASLKTLSSKRKSFVVKWNKATKKWATGYHIRYSTNSKFKSGVKNVYVGSVSTAQKTIKRLKGKKRYYVSIRAYKTVSKVKYYGAWSATKSVRTK